jgi:hypothetical protein
MRSLHPERICRTFSPCFSQPAFFGEIAFMLWLVIKDAKPPALDTADSPGGWLGAGGQGGP